MTLFDGISARIVETPDLGIGVLERRGDDPSAPPERTVVFLHGSVSSALFWQEIMRDLPGDLRVIALDLRGFGSSEHAPIDATRGVRDFSDDVAITLHALGIPSAHLVGWALGGAVAMQYALDHPVQSLVLQAPISPYGFGGTARDGSRLTADDAGCGAGTASPDFVERLTAGDDTDDAETSPRSVFRANYVAHGYSSPHEDVWVQSMLTTSTAEGNYPGDTVPSENWPGYGAGITGVLNTVAPMYFDVSGIVDLPQKPPILWIHGTVDAVVSDTSFADPNYLGQLGILQDWPGSALAPAQEMVSQTRDVLGAYAAAGGTVTEIALEGVGHTPHLERPDEFRDALLSAIGYRGTGADPSPPTEAIIITSVD